MGTGEGSVIRSGDGRSIDAYRYFHYIAHSNWVTQFPNVSPLP